MTVADITKQPCPACGAVVPEKWRRLYCEKRCVATPATTTGYTSQHGESETTKALHPPDPHLHLECPICGLAVLAAPVNVDLVALWRYGPRDGTHVYPAGAKKGR